MKTPKPTHDARARSAREALISAAIEFFGRDGFDAVSIRRIADQARVNPAMISYYFGGKEGLYAASVEHIAGQIGKRVGPVLTAVQAQLASEDSSRDELLEAFCSIADGMLGVLVRPESAAWARIILREQQDPSEHFLTLYQGTMGEVMQTCVLLHARIRGRRQPTLEDRLGTAMLMGQVAFFRSNHAAVMRLMGWDSIGPAELTVIKQKLHEHFSSVLGGHHE